MKIEILLISLALAGACVPSENEPPTAPEPIGAELLSFTTALGIPGCSEAHLYRTQQLVQFQCFATGETFSWENRGTLSVDGEAALDAALAATDFDNIEPAPDNGLCGSSETESSTTTLWVGERSFTYPPNCPTQGIAALHNVTQTLIEDISGCNELGEGFKLLASVEPGCRAY